MLSRRTVALVAAATLALALSCTNLPNPDETIFVESPEVFGRERLIAQRSQERKWLEGKLAVGTNTQAGDEIAGSREYQEFEGIVNQLTASFDPLRGATQRRTLADAGRDEELEQLKHSKALLDAQTDLVNSQKALEAAMATATATPVATATAAAGASASSAAASSASAADAFPSPAPQVTSARSMTAFNSPQTGEPAFARLPVTPTGTAAKPALESLNDQQAFRDAVRARMNQVELDDTHDLQGGTLYTLKYDIAVAPRGETSAEANVQLTIPKQSTSSNPEETLELLNLWRRHVARTIQADVRERQAEVMNDLTTRSERTPADLLQSIGVFEWAINSAYDATYNSLETWKASTGQKPVSKAAKAELQGQLAPSSISGPVVQVEFHAGAQQLDLLGDDSIAQTQTPVPTATPIATRTGTPTPAPTRTPTAEEDWRTRAEAYVDAWKNVSYDKSSGLGPNREGAELAAVEGAVMSIPREELTLWVKSAEAARIQLFAAPDPTNQTPKLRANLLSLAAANSVLADYFPILPIVRPNDVIPGLSPQGAAPYNYLFDQHEIRPEVLLDGTAFAAYIDEMKSDRASLDRRLAAVYDRVCYMVFRDKLRDAEARVAVRVQAVEPKQAAQNISDVAAKERVVNLVFQLSAVLPQYGVEAQNYTDYVNRSLTRLQTIARYPLVVGYGEQRGSYLDGRETPVFGWIFGPRYAIRGSSVKFVQQKMQHSVTATLVVPGWWDSIRIGVSKKWQGRHVSRTSTGGEELKVSLTRDFDALTRALLSPQVGGIRNPIPAVSDEYAEVPKAGVPSSGIYEVDAEVADQVIIVHGRDLWRNPEVYVGTKRPTKVETLPDMRGLAVTLPALTADNLEPRYYDLKIVTSQGTRTIRSAVAAINRKAATPARLILDALFFTADKDLVLKVSRALPPSMSGYWIRIQTADGTTGSVNGLRGIDAADRSTVTVAKAGFTGLNIPAGSASEVVIEPMLIPFPNAPLTKLQPLYDEPLRAILFADEASRKPKMSNSGVFEKNGDVLTRPTIKSPALELVLKSYGSGWSDLTDAVIVFTPVSGAAVEVAVEKQDNTTLVLTGVDMKKVLIGGTPPLLDATKPFVVKAAYLKTKSVAKIDLVIDPAGNLTFTQKQ